MKHTAPMPVGSTISVKVCRHTVPVDKRACGLWLRFEPVLSVRDSLPTVRDVSSHNKNIEDLRLSEPTGTNIALRATSTGGGYELRPKTAHILC